MIVYYIFGTELVITWGTVTMSAFLTVIIIGVVLFVMAMMDDGRRK